MAGKHSSVGGTTPTTPSSRNMEVEDVEGPRSMNTDSMHDEDDSDRESIPQKVSRKQSSLSSKSSWAPNSWFHIGNGHFKAAGKVSKSDGRLDLSVNELANNGYVAKALGIGLNRQFGIKSIERKKTGSSNETKKKKQQAAVIDPRPIPKLNIVIMVIGSRGDIQPFIKVGQILRNEHGHRVRIATHPVFKDFVEKDCGLEHFSVGGNPSELMAFMVKNPGLIPSFQTLKEGEVGRRRQQMAEMFEGFWRSCVETNDGAHEDSEVMPFVADCIISNPPVMIHVHCAERLGCPLHIMFTFPYTPTQLFPHPLANIKSSNVDEKYSNFMSYPLVELMTWSGLGDLVNDCREKILHLDPVSTIWAPGNLYRQRVPFTYMWSPALCPKPRDWGSEINIAGYVFLDQASDYKPAEGLAAFLEKGEPPVYIGFGSIVIDEPKKFTSLIFEAVEKAGVRAIINKGWGGIGTDGEVPDTIFMIDNVPHDWLFPKCKAVVHHGGAGTTAIGLKCAKPTVIVPFFGDQPFWGNMIAAAKAGAHECIPYKKLTSDKLAEMITQCFSEESQSNVQKIAEQIANEGEGAHNAVKFFHESLPLRGTHSLRSSVLEDHAAAWRMAGTDFRLSPMAATLMVQEKKLSYNDLRLVRIHAWTDFQGPGAPLTGSVGAIIRTTTGVVKGTAAGPSALSRDVRKQVKHQRKRRETTKSNQRTDSATEIPEDQAQDPSNELNQLDTSKTSTTGKNKDEATDAEPPTSKEVAQNATMGFAKPLTVIAKAPMEILLGVGQGFHNAPRLYGDNTVRKPLRVSGIKSGFRAAGHEFIYQSYDAWTGLVTQPYHGAKEDGAKGAVTGFGKGIGGLAIKATAAVVNPLGIAMKGVERELTKSKSPVPRIRDARVAQGEREVAALTQEERSEAVQQLNEGLHHIRELVEAGNRMKKRGLIGRYQFRQEKQKWIKHGVLESSAMSQKALKARSDGVPFEQFMEEHRQQVEREMNDPNIDAKTKRRKSWWSSNVPTPTTEGAEKQLQLQQSG